MITYSVSLRRDPKHPERPQQAYGQVQHTEVLDLHAFARFVSEHSRKYGESDVLAVLLAAGRHMRELFLSGKKVNLSPLGTFWLTLSTEGTFKVEEFDADSIKSVNVRFTAGQALRRLRSEAEFRKVPPRSLQSSLLDAYESGAAVCPLTPEADTLGQLSGYSTAFLADG